MAAQRGREPGALPRPAPRGSCVPPFRRKPRSGLRNDSKHTQTGGQDRPGGREWGLSLSRGQPRGARKAAAVRPAARQQRQQGSARCGPGPGRPHATHTLALLPLAGPLAVPFCEASVRLSHFLAHWLPVTCRGPYVGRPSASCAVRPGWPASSPPGDLVWGTEVPRCHASRTACLLLCDRPPWPVYAPPPPTGSGTSHVLPRHALHEPQITPRVSCQVPQQPR